MTPDEYDNLIEWHRQTHRRIYRLELAIGLILVVVVLIPVAKALGFKPLFGG